MPNTQMPNTPIMQMPAYNPMQQTHYPQLSSQVPMQKWGFPTQNLFLSPDGDFGLGAMGGGANNSSNGSITPN
jgi:hypothetical protein